MFEIYLEQLMKMKKAEIVTFGQKKGIWATSEKTAQYLLKTETKKGLARSLADRLTRLELRGY